MKTWPSTSVSAFFCTCSHDYHQLFRLFTVYLLFCSISFVHMKLLLFQNLQSTSKLYPISFYWCLLCRKVGFQNKQRTDFLLCWPAAAESPAFGCGVLALPDKLTCDYCLQQTAKQNESLFCYGFVKCVTVVQSISRYKYIHSHETIIMFLQLLQCSFISFV